MSEEDYRKLIEEYNKSVFALKKIIHFGERMTTGAYDNTSIDESNKELIYNNIYSGHNLEK